MSKPLIVCLVFATQVASAEVRVIEYKVESKPVVVVTPPGNGPWPVVYALSGLGEMVRGPKAAAWGWVEKYGLKVAMNAVHRKQLSAADLNGLATDGQLESYNSQLKKGHHGVVVVCPPVPRRLTPAFERYLLSSIVPWAERTLPIKPGWRHRGIDGISLGGRHALNIGMKHPKMFRTLGTEQAAVRGLHSKFQRLIAAQPKIYQHLDINFLTSQKDPYRRPIARMAKIFERQELNVHHTVTLGRHDKRFAKGPASIDLLMFHNTHLNGPKVGKTP